jgi:hypothetical protein
MAVILHRGCSLARAQKQTKKQQPEGFISNGNGEFGAGCYFWLDDLPAAVMSAVQYAAPHGAWAVIQLEFDEAHFRQAMTPPDGMAPKVLEFNHGRTSIFGPPGPGENKQKLTTSYVVPWDYSYVPKPGETAAAAESRVEQGPKPPQGTFGKMTAEEFRKRNADPEKYGLTGDKNMLAWQHAFIVGGCAADYSDPTLVQVKVANEGLTYLNDTRNVSRTVVVTGKQIKKVLTKIQQWKMSDRVKFYETYVKGKPDVDLDKEY